ncbi:sialin-like protein [Achlya hypogyna]|uniref:Sialin-like protein n=1 Tax=Achlya hypogyna TaxID=1202772 RepID=A0A1V9ZGY5_ACHHY|nr:sialin-like protein [Achlya hypogyna]
MIPRRIEMAALCAVGTLLCYADRTNIGVAIPAFQTDHVIQGHVLSAFFYGYICTQYLGAWIASKVGAKFVLLGGVGLWTLFDVLTVPCAHSPVLLWLVRAGMGLGEGIVFPCMHNFASAWFPISERSRLNSYITSGMDLGTIMSMLVAPLLMAACGYPSIFYTFGALSGLWLLGFAWRGSSRPETDQYISDVERTHILATRSAAAAKEFNTPHSSRSETPEVLPWRAFFAPKALRAIYASHFSYNYGWYILLGWIPQYLRTELHLELATSGFAAAVPYLAGYCGILFWGWVADQLIAHGVRLLTVRKLTNGFGLVGSALCLYLLRFASSTFGAVAMLSFTLFLSRAAASGYWVNMIDVAPRHAGHIMGISNTIATLPGIFGNILTGKILAQTGDWNLVFLIASAVLTLGGIVFQCWAGDHDVFARDFDDDEADDLNVRTPLLHRNL